jgi:hypothetical protein
MDAQAIRGYDFNIEAKVASDLAADFGVTSPMLDPTSGDVDGAIVSG